MNLARRREVLRTAQRTTMRHLADGSIQYPRDARPA
jgi:hypothetical protein